MVNEGTIVGVLSITPTVKCEMSADVTLDCNVNLVENTKRYDVSNEYGTTIVIEQEKQRATNKVVYFGETLIDLTGDSVTKEKLLSGITAHDKTGAVIQGECTFDSDTTDADVSIDEILFGKTAYARGAKITGRMPNRGSATGSISNLNDSYAIEQGYHDGSGRVAISEVERLKVVPQNIRKGVSILGIEGSMEEDSPENPQSKTVTPSKTQQTVLPDTGYTCLRQVVVNAIPYVETLNSANGTTVTIGQE